MNILVACEKSQAVTIELRKLGHNAFSCEECKQEHIQLLNWLIELKEYKERENNG